MLSFIKFCSQLSMKLAIKKRTPFIRLSVFHNKYNIVILSCLKGFTFYTSFNYKSRKIDISCAF